MTIEFRQTNLPSSVTGFVQDNAHQPGIKITANDETYQVEPGSINTKKLRLHAGYSQGKSVTDTAEDEPAHTDKSRSVTADEVTSTSFTVRLTQNTDNQESFVMAEPARNERPGECSGQGFCLKQPARICSTEELRSITKPAGKPVRNRYNTEFDYNPVKSEQETGGCPAERQNVVNLSVTQTLAERFLIVKEKHRNS